MILPSGVSVLDRILNGGLHTGIFTHVYGDAASGKTTLALQFVKNAHRLNLGTIYVNSENTSPIERLEQMTAQPFSEIQGMVKILAPKGFNEQGALIDDLELYLREDTKLVIIDTLTRYYRLELEDKKTNYERHRELNRQAGVLKGLARNHKVAVLVLNQVRAQIKGMDDFEPVAKNILDYWSDYTIKLRVARGPGERIIKRIMPEGEFSDGRLYLIKSGLSPDKPHEKE
ncbi:MAG: ATPase domain-containing protein [Candidatus Thorarchaeota archaeon SMTZ1-45]